jgi:tetratricopeptide (TPR) repeat protein
MLARCFRTLTTLAALTVVAGAANAQSNSHSAECSGLRYAANFRLNSAKLYLDLAVAKQRTDPDRFQGAMRDAQRQLDEALRAGGGDEMTLAFFYGEIGTLRDDMVGADSMFTKAEAKANDECKREISRMRRNSWAYYANAAVNLQRTQHVDSALALLRKGNQIWRGEPTGFLRMAGIFVARTQNDSAIVYTGLACHSTEDPRFLELRKAACITNAQLLLVANRAPEAEVGFRDYLHLAPRDLTAMAGLGASLSAQGKTADANVLYDSLSVATDTVTDADDLFDTATQLVRAHRYQLAARIYERELTINRCHRDALYNLASTYNSLRDSVRMLAAAQRLVAVDPMNRAALAMLAQAQVLMRDTSSVGTLMRLQGLPWTFDLIRFTPGDTSAALQGALGNTGDHALPPFRLTVEFLNGACEPVGQTVVEVPQVEANGSQTLDVTGHGRGIRSYRYRAN